MDSEGTNLPGETGDFYTKLADRLGVSRTEAKMWSLSVVAQMVRERGQGQETAFSQVAQFHRKFGLEYEGDPRELEPDMALFRIGFMIEELGEYAEASGYRTLSILLKDIHEYVKSGPEAGQFTVREEERDLEKQFDALIDLVYVAHGTAYLQGFPFDSGYDEVHRANMRKVRVTSTLEGSSRKSKYDVVKPEGWVAPDLKPFLLKGRLNGGG